MTVILQLGPYHTTVTFKDISALEADEMTFRLYQKKVIAYTYSADDVKSIRVV